jgi:hypothetical protein
MKFKPIPQEGLKLIACICMLIDHIGAYLVPWVGLRIIGRIAFPIFCFLLTQGAIHTRNPARYACRLFLFALISELPFDLLRFGRFSMAGQSVMVTLLLGFGMLMILKTTEAAWKTIAVIAAAMVAGELLKCDYGGYGVCLIAVFALTEGCKGSLPARLCALVYPGIEGVVKGEVNIQIFAVLALIPLSAYSGRAISRGNTVKWTFYLFYPAHLTIILYILFLLQKFR